MAPSSTPSRARRLEKRPFFTLFSHSQHQNRVAHAMEALEEAILKALKDEGRPESAQTYHDFL